MNYKYIVAHWLVGVDKVVNHEQGGPPGVVAVGGVPYFWREEGSLGGVRGHGHVAHHGEGHGCP